MKAFKKSIFFKILAFVLLVLPTLVLVYIKKDVYFVKANEIYKISIGGALTIAFVVLCVLGKIKMLDKTIIIAIIWGLSFLLKTLINDILWVCPCCIVGTILFNIFNYFSKHYHEIYLIQRNAKLDQSARQEVKQETTIKGLGRA